MIQWLKHIYNRFQTAEKYCMGCEKYRPFKNMLIDEPYCIYCHYGKKYPENN